MQTVKFPLVVEIVKSGAMIYFSQLDLVNILERSLRRTALPLHYTQGFNPHVKISLLSGSKVGEAGIIKARFYLSEKTLPRKVQGLLSSQLPEGLSIQNITE